MNVVYRTVWTEYEAGMGQRPDGVSYAFDKGTLERHIKRIEAIGDYGCYSRASKITLCIINDELRNKIVDNDGVYTTPIHDDPGMLGEFKPTDPMANIETSKKRLEQAG